VRREFNILALVKADERYVYVYDDESRAALMSVLRDHAADPDVSLSWFDAAVLVEKLREQAQAGPAPPSPSRSRV
jgi:hypothetical protein